MILLDPDLDPDNAAPRTKRPAASSRADCLPSVRSLSMFLHKAQAAVRLQGEVSVLLTSDAAIKKLNRQFRGKNKATDVLSFPADPGPEKMAGDLAISMATAQKQAAEQGHALAVEIKVLMLHGLLHLAGYDHETDDGEMARLEQKLRARLALPSGLIERVSASGSLKRTKRKATAGPSTRSLGELAQDDKSRGARAGKKRAGARRRTS